VQAHWFRAAPFRFRRITPLKGASIEHRAREIG
jgi:hypothetical protein